MAIERPGLQRPKQPWHASCGRDPKESSISLPPQARDRCCNRRAPADRQGVILGVNQSAAALARILGPVFGLSLYTLTANHLLPYAFGSGLLLLMLPLLPRIKRG